MTKLIDLIENFPSKKPITVEYFQQLLNRSNTSPKNREYIQKVIDSIKKAGNMGTYKQYTILKNFEQGK
jgi:hypothetical protein